MRPFVERLRERGVVQGHNLTILYRSAEGRPERLAELASELVASKPDVIVAGQGTLTALAAKEATTTIPIVFTIVGDPVASGVVASLARPGGNVTGMSGQVTEIGGKRLQLVQEASPARSSWRSFSTPPPRTRCSPCTSFGAPRPLPAWT
jgi:putative ABC transport system substrate-binding protein